MRTPLIIRTLLHVQGVQIRDRGSHCIVLHTECHPVIHIICMSCIYNICHRQWDVRMAVSPATTSSSVLCTASTRTGIYVYTVYHHIYNYYYNSNQQFLDMIACIILYLCL